MDYFDVLLAKKLEGGGGGDVTIEQLDVTENGTYSEPGKAYRPVIVNLPLDEKTITANGTYNASDDNLKGYNKVIVNVEGYKLKAMTPGAIASFNDGQALPLTKLLIDIEPVQTGSGDPSPTNERPIYGWNAANISIDGANIWDEEWEVGTINVTTGEEVVDNTRIRNKGYIAIKENTTYHFTVPVNDGRIVFYKADKTYLSSLPGSTIFSNKKFTSPSGAYYVRFSTVPAYGTTYNNDISINYPSTDTSYHAYNGQFINIEFKDGTNPLVVYGATIEPLTGLLTVDKVNVDLSTLHWTYDPSSNRWQSSSLSNTIKIFTTRNGDMISDRWAADIAASSGSEYKMFNVNGAIYLYTTDNINSPTGNLVYPLATPETYQLTPTQINALLGVNNIFADTGDILEGEYFAAL